MTVKLVISGTISHHANFSWHAACKTQTQKHTHLFDRISEIYNFAEFEYSDIKQITEEISEIEITKDAIHLIHNKAKSFRQIVNTIDTFEKVAQANGFTQIDKNIAMEVLNGGF